MHVGTDVSLLAAVLVERAVVLCEKSYCIRVRRVRRNLKEVFEECEKRKLRNRSVVMVPTIPLVIFLLGEVKAAMSKVDVCCAQQDAVEEVCPIPIIPVVLARGRR